jgi:hypothetical protein
VKESNGAMSEDAVRALAETLTREHRMLDELFGGFLSAAARGDAEAARRAIEEFDRELRRHTALEEERLLPKPTGHKLAPPEEEQEEERLFRELRLEHVQVREVSAMIVRQLAEKSDLAGASALAGNLARRWDAHTTREERDLFARIRQA